MTMTVQTGGLPEMMEDCGEVRILDTSLAKRLGYERPRAIRQLIARHHEALSQIAPIITGMGKGGKGQTVTGSYLNEAQALFILAKSETPRANIELTYLAGVCTEYRRGNLIAKNEKVQAAIDAAEAARFMMLGRHIEENEAQRGAFLFMRRR